MIRYAVLSALAAALMLAASLAAMPLIGDGGPPW